MKSMTGLGTADYDDGKYSVSLTVKSVNNRYLDININLPYSYQLLEPEIRSFISSKITRGSVDVYLKIKESSGTLKLEYDENEVKAYADVFAAISRAAGIHHEMQLSSFLKIEGLIKSTKESDADALSAIVKNCLEKAFNDFNCAREKEGLMTLQDILKNVELIKTELKLIESKASLLKESISKNLKDKFAEILGSKIDEDRLLTETAVLIVRYDINEEITRFKSHLDTFTALACGNEAVSKKLDFICQELNREINTVTSKSTIYEINNAAVNIKDALEKIREQLRNAE
jgi:uncharacterized protein (TIGR00255 family)